MSLSPATKRYNLRMIWLWLLYAVFLLPAVYSFKHRLVSGDLAYVLAVLPAVPIIGVFGTVGRYLVEESDEYLRMLMVRQTLWAGAIALSLATVWGFLESFELVSHIASYYIAVVWFFGLAIGAIINKLTLGDGHPC